MKDVNINPRYLTYNKDEVQTILSQVEHIDTTPTEDSSNPVTSGGVKNELDKYTTTEVLTALLANKQDALTVASEADVRSLVTEYGSDAQGDSSE